MKKLSAKLENRRQLLLQRHEARDLHAFRVALRRVRSRLKPIPGKKARQLRRDLGALARATNETRDWDTLLANARFLLPEDQFQLLAPCLEVKQKAARDCALKVLQSKKCTATLRRWGEREQRFHPLSEETSGYSNRDLSRTLRALDTARRRALSRDDDKHWHKLRIAIKNLRYQLDATPKEARSDRERACLTQCKELQSDLGEWHDAVVHGQLLREIASELDPARQALACAALNSLHAAIQQRGRRYLDSARARLHQMPGMP